MIDFEVAYDKLASLKSADEIANLMKDYNIKAVPGDSMACAITQWLHDQTGLDIMTGAYVVKAIKFVNIKSPSGLNDGFVSYEPVQDKVRSTTVAMQLFIQRFDKGYYPDLIGLKHRSFND